MSSLGYVEGRNLHIEIQYTSSGESAQAAAELIALKLDVILVSGVFVASAVKAANSTILIKRPR
jgi:hypothetical protein